jgi:hypothetical protein
MWPNTKYIDTIVTGSMAQYVPTLNRYSGGLPIISMMYLEPELGHEGDGGIHQLVNGSYRRVEKQRQEYCGSTKPPISVLCHYARPSRCLLTCVLSAVDLWCWLADTCGQPQRPQNQRGAMRATAYARDRNRGLCGRGAGSRNPPRLHP